MNDYFDADELDDSIQIDIDIDNLPMPDELFTGVDALMAQQRYLDDAPEYEPYENDALADGENWAADW